MQYNGGVPVANVEVDARVQCSCEGFATVGEAQTAEDGTYDLVIAPITEPYFAHNTFYVLFDSPAGDYAPEWYDNGASVFDATPIYVADGGTASDKNVRLAPGSHVTGTVTGPGGAPVAGAIVFAPIADYDNWGAEFHAKTAEDGSYDLGPLPASTYNLEFRSDDYHGKISGVVVAAGETLRKDARLGYRLYVRNIQRPAITGKPKVGQRVRATPGLWNPAQVTLTYRWRVAGRWVAGARHSFYRPRAADAGKRLRVRIRATAPGRGAATATSPAKIVAKVTLRVTTTKLKVPGRD